MESIVHTSSQFAPNVIAISEAFSHWSLVPWAYFESDFLGLSCRITVVSWHPLIKHFYNNNVIAFGQKDESGIFFILGSKNYLSDFFITNTAQFWAQFSTKSNAPVFAFLQALWTWLIARRSITKHSAWLGAGKMRAGPVTRLQSTFWGQKLAHGLEHGGQLGVQGKSQRWPHVRLRSHLDLYSQCEDVPFCTCSRFQYTCMDVHNLTKHRKARSTPLALLWDSRNLGQCAHKIALSLPSQYIEECKVESIFLGRDDHMVELFHKVFCRQFLLDHPSKHSFVNDRK